MVRDVPVHLPKFRLGTGRSIVLLESNYSFPFDERWLVNRGLLFWKPLTLRVHEVSAVCSEAFLNLRRVSIAPVSLGVSWV